MRRRFKYTIFIFLFLSAARAYSLENEALPKNIILFIADGASVGCYSAAKIVKGNLNIERCTTGGLLAVNPFDKFLPKSESSTTAMATGVMTNSTYISISPSGDRLKTVLEYAEERGKSTGLVVTSSVTDATPACFAAHVKGREYHSVIAEEMVASGVDVLFGGGLEYFIPSSEKGSARKDDKDLVAELRKRHPVVVSQKAFSELGMPSGAFAFLSLGDLLSVKNREISLSDMARKAIDILSTGKNGFFLMVEGSYIDWAAHRADMKRVVAEMTDFDDAVGVGMDFAEKNGETLIIVLSDHDTAGFTVLDGSIEQKTIKTTVCMAKDHTGNMVPFFAYGPGSGALGGMHNIAYIGQTIIKYVIEN